jgi:hypothetical protein
MVLPSLPRVLTGRVPLLPRYYGALRLPASLSPRLVAFAWRYPALRPSFRSLRSRSPNRGPGVHQPVPTTGKIRRETFRISQVPEESLCAYALLSDPGRTDSSGPTTQSTRPPLCPRRRLPQQIGFRGSITRPWHSLSTLRQVHCCTRRKTCFPLLATLRDGIGYPQDSNERFPSCFLHLFLPSQAWPGARTSPIPIGIGDVPF